jgi:hypothetical protein
VQVHEFSGEELADVASESFMPMIARMNRPGVSGELSV